MKHIGYLGFFKQSFLMQQSVLVCLFLQPCARRFDLGGSRAAQPSSLKSPLSCSQRRYPGGRDRTCHWSRWAKGGVMSFETHNTMHIGFSVSVAKTILTFPHSFGSSSIFTIILIFEKPQALSLFRAVKLISPAGAAPRGAESRPQRGGPPGGRHEWERAGKRNSKSSES